MGFKVGDRVKVISNNHESKDYTGEVGTIVNLMQSDGCDFFGVGFDKEIGIHHCGGACKPGYGYYAFGENLELLP